MGADIGSETTNGGTVLWWARRMLPEDHEVIHYFEGINAPDVWSGDEESADSEGGREENEEENKEENEENFPADDTDATGFVSNE